MERSVSASTHPNPLVTKVFILAGLTNIVGLAIFNQGFTNASLVAASPQVASNFSAVLVMVWGLAYLSVARVYDRVPLLIAVFAIEKFVFAWSWVAWLMHSAGTLPELYEQNLLTGLFYSCYGIVDGAFGVFFALVAWSCLRADQPH